jgi:hypothetical protein
MTRSPIMDRSEPAHDAPVVSRLGDEGRSMEGNAPTNALPTPLPTAFQRPTNGLSTHSPNTPPALEGPRGRWNARPSQRAKEGWMRKGWSARGKGWSMDKVFPHQVYLADPSFRPAVRHRTLPQAPRAPSARVRP